MPVAGGGGGGGGAEGASMPGMPAGGGGGGGGGGGAVATALLLSDTAGGGGADKGGGGGAIGLCWTGVADFEDGFSSVALRGRGGPIVPKRILASCLALPPPGRSLSLSEDSPVSDSTSDQSYSSGRVLDFRSNGPGAGCGVKADLASCCCCCC